MKREKGSEAKHKAWLAYRAAERVFQETERACRDAEQASQKAARIVQDAWQVYRERVYRELDQEWLDQACREFNRLRPPEKDAEWVWIKGRGCVSVNPRSTDPPSSGAPQ